MKPSIVMTLAVVLVAMVTPIAAASVPDPAWGAGGVAQLSVPANTVVVDTAPLSDGRVVVVGYQDAGGSPWQAWGAIVSATGTTMAPLTGFAATNVRFTAVAVGSDRIVAAGESDQGTATNAVVESFDMTGARVGGSEISLDEQTIPTSAAIDGQGRVFVAGYAQGDAQRAWVERRTKDGAVDASFSTRFLETTDALTAQAVAYVGVTGGQTIAVVTELRDPSPGSLMRFHRITDTGSVFMADFTSARAIVDADIDSTSGEAVFGSLTNGVTATDSTFLVHAIDVTGVPLVTTSGTWIDVAGRIEIGRLRTDELLGAGESDLNTFVHLVQTGASFGGRSDSELIDVATSSVDGGVYVSSLDVPSGDLAIVKFQGDGSGRFIDDDASVHESNIERLEELGVTRGCNPPINDEFCPAANVTRGQMAAFLNRALDLPESTTDHFTDDNGSIFENDIDAIAQAGITLGCNPPTNDRFCPGDIVTRGQMAAFLKRAFSLPGAPTDFFIDDTGSVFESSINAIAHAGITLGCNPPANDRFCPTSDVTREQMASFLVRALDG